MIEQSKDWGSEPSYQRSHKDTEILNDAHQKETKISFKLDMKHRIAIIFASLLVTATTIVIPFLEHFTTNVQSFHLYTGQMLWKGQLPYSDIFSTAGFLYYILVGTSFALGSQLWLLGIQFFALYFSGLYFYRLVHYYSQDKTISLISSVFFYLANLGLGFGGLYPIQWATPFVLIGTWFLIQYIDNNRKDEHFIVHGACIALSLLIEPRTLIFWLITFIGISIHNLKQKLWARGFYQNLATIFGLILIFYIAGYFIFNMELLLPYLSQTLVSNLTTIYWGNSIWWQSILIQLGLSLFSGILIGILGFIKYGHQNDQHLLPKLVILITSITYLTSAMFSKIWNGHFLLFALPFGLILTSISIQKYKEEKESVTNSHRRQEDMPNFFSLFLMSHLGGPIVLALIGIGLPVYTYYQNQDLHKERQVVINYINDHTTEEDELIIFDDNAKIYTESQRFSATRYPLTNLYLANAKNKSDFKDEILENQASLVIVSEKEKISDEIKRNVENYYLEVTPDSLKQFKIYSLK